MILSINNNLVHVFLGPSNQVVDVRKQKDSPVGTRAFDTGQNFGMHLPFDKSVFLKRSQRNRQHFLRDIGNVFMQSTETHQGCPV